MDLTSSSTTALCTVLSVLIETGSLRGINRNTAYSRRSVLSLRAAHVYHFYMPLCLLYNAFSAEVYFQKRDSKTSGALLISFYLPYNILVPDHERFTIQ